ncbi:MAG: helix-turn-helix domain-containing protein [Chitinivibrionales bacterium]|nr:helix-turn-helix domain-containing protein [Chitinivibrionales bacterium]
MATQRSASGARYLECGQTMYFCGMLQSRREILDQFKDPELVAHAAFRGCRTFSFLSGWLSTPISVSLPRLQCRITGIDYLQSPPPGGKPPAPIRFQQDHYRLWYQLDGTGILQNLRQKAFGRAAPGLLGVMDIGERHSYLHQRGTFECFMVDFMLQPAAASQCYWNSDIEGKRMLADDERLYVENHAFELMRLIGNGADPWGLRCLAHLAEIVALPVTKGLIVIDDERFPHDRAVSLVKKAKRYMDTHYAELQHQRAISEYCGVDINYLNILFKREKGMTLYKYLTNVRMEHAKHLLEQGQRNIVGIAEKIGYPNSNSFSRAFRRYAGIAPSEYVHRHQQPLGPARTRSAETTVETTGGA